MNQCIYNSSGVKSYGAIIFSNFCGASLLTVALLGSGAKIVFDGLFLGAIFGCFYALSTDLPLWSLTTMYNDFVVMLVDVGQTTVLWALTGLVIVLLWGKDKTV